MDGEGTGNETPVGTTWDRKAGSKQGPFSGVKNGGRRGGTYGRVPPRRPLFGGPENGPRFGVTKQDSLQTAVQGQGPAALAQFVSAQKGRCNTFHMYWCVGTMRQEYIQLPTGQF